MEIDRWATHLDLLYKVFKHKKINRVVEFGGGVHSTRLFSNMCDYVLTVEMQSEEWFNKIRTIYEKPTHKFVFAEGPSAFFTDVVYENYDLAFVDGHGDSRPEVINHMASFCSTIVTHDLEWPGYGWERVRLPSNYIRFDDQREWPWTALWTTDKELIEKLNHG
jgi:predicted O-methyltransferase YrrM